MLHLSYILKLHLDSKSVENFHKGAKSYHIFDTRDYVGLQYCYANPGNDTNCFSFPNCYSCHNWTFHYTQTEGESEVGEDGVVYKTTIWKVFSVSLDDKGIYKCVGVDEDVVQAQVLVTLNILGKLNILSVRLPYKRYHTLHMIITSLIETSGTS